MNSSNQTAVQTGKIIKSLLEAGAALSGFERSPSRAREAGEASGGRLRRAIRLNKQALLHACLALRGGEAGEGEAAAWLGSPESQRRAAPRSSSSARGEAPRALDLALFLRDAPELVRRHADLAELPAEARPAPFVSAAPPADEEARREEQRLPDALSVNKFRLELPDDFDVRSSLMSRMFPLNIAEAPPRPEEPDEKKSSRSSRMFRQFRESGLCFDGYMTPKRSSLCSGNSFRLNGSCDFRSTASIRDFDEPCGELKFEPREEPRRANSEKRLAREEPPADAAPRGRKICKANAPRREESYTNFPTRLNFRVLPARKPAPAEPKRQRGKYRICDSRMKAEAIHLCNRTSVREAAARFQVAEKNIKRWVVSGPFRKKGAGRKTMDPVMEAALLEWMEREMQRTRAVPDSKDIKEKARGLSRVQNFKASKGWCDKFMRRNAARFAELKEKFGILDPPK